MDFKLGSINFKGVAQGVGGLVFGNENSSSEDSYVERLLDRISNGTLAEDRRTAIAELLSIVSESQSAQLAFGAMGFPVLLSVLREERDDIEMVRGAVETLVAALSPLEFAQGPKNNVQPALLNSDLLSRESDSISLLLSLLAEDDFYVRYYTLQLLILLLTHFPSRLQEAILSIPGGTTQLMDKLADRDAIRNEAILLLTHLTREAEEIQKIVVFDGAFDKIFSIIKEEGGSEGDVVVQDCLQLLSNLLRGNASNQILLKETVGFDPLISLLKLRKGSANKFTQQKTVNLLSTLATIELLLMGDSESDSAKDGNRISNQNVLAQKNILDYLLLLGVESRWAPVPVRCSAFRCIGHLILKNPQNLSMLSSKLIGEDPHTEPALNLILRIALRTDSTEEFLAAEYVFKCYCEKNMEGQTHLASTISSQTLMVSNRTLDSAVDLSFGSMLLQDLVYNEANRDLEGCCRAASVFSHIIKDNIACKEKALQLYLEPQIPSLGSKEPLMNQVVRYLALASSTRSSLDQGQANSEEKSHIKPVIFRLLIQWLADCPAAVSMFLDSPAHLTYMLELVSNPNENVCVRGMAAMLLGECVIYNNSVGQPRDAFTVVNTISEKIGLASYFLRYDEMQKSLYFISAMPAPEQRPMMRSGSASNNVIDDGYDGKAVDQKQKNLVLASLFSGQFVNFIKRLEVEIREGIVETYSRPKSKVSVFPADMDQKEGENDRDYIKRLKSFMEKQCCEMQDLLGRNTTLAEDLAKNGGGGGVTTSDQKLGGARDRVQTEGMRRDLQEAHQRLEAMKQEKAKVELEASKLNDLARKYEVDLKSLSDAYNSLDQANYCLESEVKALRSGGTQSYPDLDAVRAEAREEAEKESEAELNDLLVCLGQEQSKVEKLSARLTELGEDVDSLLEGIGDDAGGLGQDEDEDEEEDDD